MGQHIDLITVVIAALVNMLIGMVWYSKYLFGESFMKYFKVKATKGQTHLWKQWVYGFGVSLVMAFVLAFFEMHLGIANVRDGVFVGFMMWLGFVATVHFDGVVWSDKPFHIYCIMTFRQLLGLFVMGGLLAA